MIDDDDTMIPIMKINLVPDTSEPLKLGMTRLQQAYFRVSDTSRLLVDNTRVPCRVPPPTQQSCDGTTLVRKGRRLHLDDSMAQVMVVKSELDTISESTECKRDRYERHTHFEGTVNHQQANSFQHQYITTTKAPTLIVATTLFWFIIQTFYYCQFRW